MRAIGETNASSMLEGMGIHALLFVAPTVILVVSDVPPDSVAGAKLQAHPLGRPEQAKDTEALNPFFGATVTIKDPGVPWVMVRVLLDSVRL
jgi:hypothetical protein